MGVRYGLAPLAHLNKAVLVFRSLTMPEISGLLLVGLLVVFPGSMLFAALLGVWTLGFLLGLILFIALFTTANLYKSNLIKRDSPESMRHTVRVALHRSGVMKAPTIQFTGHWSLGRYYKRTRRIRT